MKLNGREIYNSKVSKQMWDVEIRKSIEDYVKTKKFKKRQEYINSDKHKSEQRAREIAQNFSRKHSELVKDLKLASKELANNIYEFIKTELNVHNKAIKLNGYIQPKIQLKKIKEIIDLCVPALEKLKVLSSHELIHYHKGMAYTEYENLFNNLIELDARFAIFAPLNQINRSNNEPRIELLEDKYKKMLEHEKTVQTIDCNKDYVYRNNGVEVNDNRSEKITTFVDNINSVQFAAKFTIIKATECLCSETYKFIVDELDLYMIDEKELKFTEIKTVLEMCQSAISTLKTYSHNQKLNEIAAWDEFDPHTELFNHLIKLNIKFAFFAPKKSLSRLDIDFNKLSEKEKVIMFDLLNKFNLWEDHEFYEKNHLIFIDIINEKHAKNEI